MGRRVLRVEIYGVRDDDHAFQLSTNVASDLLSKLWAQHPELSPAAILDAALVKLALEQKEK